MVEYTRLKASKERNFKILRENYMDFVTIKTIYNGSKEPLKQERTRI